MHPHVMKNSFFSGCLFSYRLCAGFRLGGSPSSRKLLICSLKKNHDKNAFYGGRTEQQNQDFLSRQANITSLVDKQKNAK